MKNLHTTLLFAALFAPLLAFAQQFKPIQVNPFGIQINDNVLLQGFAMGDMNHDSLPDLLFTDEVAFNTFLVINQGAPGQPDFSASPVLDYEDESNGYGEGSLILFHDRMVDFDNDQDLDHLYNYISDDPTQPSNYAIELNQPELVPANNYDFFFLDETDLTPYGIPYIPLNNYESFDYRDITGDGMADILATRIDEITGAQAFVFYKRQTATSFAAPVTNPFGLQSVFGLFGQPCLLDVDQDGDQDMFLLDGQTGNWLFYKNKGTAQAPQFLAAVENPFGLTPVPETGAMAFVMDINLDGKDDLLAANFQDFFYFEASPTVSAPEIPLAANVQVFPTLIRDKCQVLVNGNVAMDKILVGDVRGGTVSILESTPVLDFQTFAPGVYFVTVIMEDGSRYSQKVVKVR